MLVAVRIFVNDTLAVITPVGSNEECADDDGVPGRALADGGVPEVGTAAPLHTIAVYYHLHDGAFLRCRRQASRIKL